MITVTVYDPPQCCTTGVCGPSVDPKLAQFASDLEWLKKQGLTVRRFNLAQEPGVFVENGTVKAILEQSGEEGLPVILIDDKLASSGRIPPRQELSAMTGLEAEIDPSENVTSSGGCGCAEASTGCR